MKMREPTKRQEAAAALSQINGKNETIKSQAVTIDELIEALDKALGFVQEEGKPMLEPFSKAYEALDQANKDSE